MLVGTTRQDEAIPYEQSVGPRNRWCARGVNLHFEDIPAGDHLTGILNFSTAAVDFLADPKERVDDHRGKGLPA